MVEQKIDDLTVKSLEEIVDLTDLLVHVLLFLYNCGIVFDCMHVRIGKFRLAYRNKTRRA